MPRSTTWKGGPVLGTIMLDQRADRDRAETGLLRLLVEATLRLEGLTWALIVLTAVLIVLTGVLAYDVIRHHMS